ncbi:hypothetical protein [Microcystis sp.]|uniref:hypothetical protein n=1 Tax=Microcystis sp. TaxID=1127 RepID=UPI00391D0E2C
MFKKTSQFSGKAQPNTQNLNLSESFCWVSLGVLLGFLFVGFPWVYCWVSLRLSARQGKSDRGFPTSRRTVPPARERASTRKSPAIPTAIRRGLDTRSILNLTPKKAIDLTARFLALG